MADAYNRFEEVVAEADGKPSPSLEKEKELRLLKIEQDIEWIKDRLKMLLEKQAAPLMTYQYPTLSGVAIAAEPLIYPMGNPNTGNSSWPIPPPFSVTWCNTAEPGPAEFFGYNMEEGFTVSG